MLAYCELGIKIAEGYCWHYRIIELIKLVDSISMMSEGEVVAKRITIFTL